jgi:hypothetical protein
MTGLQNLINFKIAKLNHRVIAYLLKTMFFKVLRQEKKKQSWEAMM